jgi:non-ribosomal peptide synthetase component F
LLNGGTCVLHPENGIVTPGGLGESIAAQGVTAIWLTASVFNSLVSDHPEALLPVRQLLTGGEALSVVHVRKALKLLPGTRLFNGYGPTENTTFTTVYPIPRDLPEDVQRVPIGSPIQGTTCGLFDENLAAVAEKGKPGELITFGLGLATGYLNRPDLTAERFIQVKCADGAVRNGYRTGDLVVQREDFHYDFLQRTDKQVKIDGHRIEPGEIELFLNELEGRNVWPHTWWAKTPLKAAPCAGSSLIICRTT